MSDCKKNMIIQSLDSLLPFLMSALPAETRDKHICSLVYESLKSFNTDMARNLANQLVYDDVRDDGVADSCPYSSSSESTPFSVVIGICQYLNDLVCEHDKYAENIKKIRKLNVVLSLPAEKIIEKNLNFKLANLNVSETIKRAVSNGYSYKMCDSMLTFAHTLIFKFLSLKVSELSVTDMVKTIENLNIANRF